MLGPPCPFEGQGDLLLRLHFSLRSLASVFQHNRVSLHGIPFNRLLGLQWYVVGHTRRSSIGLHAFGVLLERLLVLCHFELQLLDAGLAFLDLRFLVVELL